MGHEMLNPRTGQRMEFLLTATETAGELVRMRTVNPPTAVAEPNHVHPRQETRARMISGELLFVVDGVERRIGAGEEIVIAAGVAHHFVNDGDEEAVAIQEARPALHTAEFFETYFALAARGEIAAHGRPSLLRMAVLAPAFSDEIRVVSPPWRVQQALFALLRPFARLRGYAAPVLG